MSISRTDPFTQPPFRVRDHWQLRQHTPRPHRNIIRIVRCYHSSQNYDNRQNLARGATGDAYIVLVAGTQIRRGGVQYVRQTIQIIVTPGRHEGGGSSLLEGNLADQW
jgi:hypothetical protein